MSDFDFFCNEILEDENIKNLLNDTENKIKYGNPAVDIAEKIKKGERCEVERGYLQIFVCAHLADYALEKNSMRNIPKEITVQTLKDINIWIENYFVQYGEVGLGEFDWLINHYTGDLFRLGRLQFRLEKPLKNIPTENKAIETHIPQGEPLTEEECLKSFAQAEVFFKKYFPQEKPEYFMCDSWLLNRNLALILPETSNTVRFMRLWTPVEFESDNSFQAKQRVFGFNFNGEIKDAPEKTGLQRALKNFLLKGGSLDISAGYRKITQ